MEFKFNYNATIFDTINKLGNVTQKVKVVLSDGSSFAFEGQFSIKYNGGSVNSVAEMTVSVALSSDLEFTAKS